MSPTIPKTVMRHLNDSTRQRLKAQTEAPVSWTTGVPYDQPHGDLSDYQVFRPRARATLTKAKATQLLVDFLTPIQPLHESQKAALTRLNGATNKADWDPSLVIKALGDLDVAFFDGWLRGNLIAVWATEEKIVEQVYDGKKPVGNFAGLCQTLDRRENEGEQRCKVWLNSDVIFDVPDPRLKMWEVIFHELVHAYTLITTDHNVFVDYHAQADPGHDAQFQYLLSMVDRRSVRHMQISAKPAGKGHTICLPCNPRPSMPGDPGFGKDEQGQMLRGQRNDPEWPTVDQEAEDKAEQRSGFAGS